MKQVAALSMLLAGIAPAAYAQQQTTTSSWGEILTYDYRYDGRRNDSYQTRLTATLDGVDLLYDQTFWRAFDDPMVQAGLSAATSLRGFNDRGAPAVVRWGAPQLIDSYEEFLDSFTETSVETLAPRYVTTVQTTSGDASNNIAIIGERGGCFDTGVSGATNYGAFDGAFANCDSYEEFEVAPGTINTNTHTTAIIETIETSFTNEDYLNLTHYQVTGTLMRIGTVHTAAQGEAIGAGADLATRLLDVEARTGRAAAWVQGHAMRSDLSASGGIPGYRAARSGASLGGWFTPAGNWWLGGALDQTQGHLEIAAASERSAVELTQAALQAGYQGSVAYAQLALAGGRGHVATRHGDDGLGGVSLARYDVDVTTAALELGARWRHGGWSANPHAGLEAVEAETDAFAESGGVALAAPGHTTRRVRAWMGFRGAHEWTWAEGRGLRVDLRARWYSVRSGRARSLPVAFVDMPDDPMRIHGATEAATTAEIGIAADLRLGRHLSLFAAYHRREGGDADARAAQAGLRIDW
ncbi:autotransporter outer membrane beta-barrel domain-containing protein [Pseudoxanthomonas sp. PXM02]|uniref:autotransporter outer membrane beta-barrel domain-containing protein n=1 Tax=Pseudoxanthomonas sp. PXM02 TaxID=2769294 RepID=UPI001786B96B|nr:autotransporter outer membrane beta-barrel domain-containing protein [Pseudoxanthomonas sp. PXM02]MBD9480230.1 autotransporter outer membrane beta-barrel domain-containing protein [Pseudoxanthomonas sp. PXM02]